VAVEGEKDWRYPLRIKAGMDYQIHPRFAVRWGVGTEPATFHAGISWNLLQKMAINSGWRYHNRIGSTLSASVSSTSK
jgi:hypothetical protein